MPLVFCNDCGNKVSTAAATCPKCGAPVAVSRVFAPSEQPALKKPSTAAVVGLALSIGIFVGVAVLAYPMYRAQSDQKSRIEAENTRIQNLPAMPIEVTYRKALLGSGLVASLKNTSNRFLSVRAALTNPSLHQSMSYRVDLSPGKVKEIGHMEGWAFSSGDTIFVSHDEYRELKVSIP